MLNPKRLSTENQIILKLATNCYSDNSEMNEYKADEIIIELLVECGFPNVSKLFAEIKGMT